MKILVTGATGFVGSQIVTDLIKAGHEVVCCVQNVAYAKTIFPKQKIIYGNFIKETKESDWLPKLNDIDVVINTVGIFYHPLKKIIWTIHYETPKAIFDACVKKNIKKIIHISALNVDKYDVDYAKSKFTADQYLLSLPISSVILRPSLIYAHGSYGGTSLFRGLVGLPLVIPVPGKGAQLFQPIFLEDLSKAILHLIETHQEKNKVLSAVSAEPISLKQILKDLRSWLGFPKAFILSIPPFFIRLVSYFGDIFPYSTLNSSGYKMLMQNNIAEEKDAHDFVKAIGFTPRNFTQGLFSEPSHVQDRWHAKLYFVKPLLQLSLAFLWLFTALTSAFLFSKSESYGLLNEVGINSFWQPIFLYGASMINAFIGFALLFNYKIKKICLLQMIIILGYTFIISIKLPQFWLEPFGPITKNIPLLVAIYILYILEDQK